MISVELVYTPPPFLKCGLGTETILCGLAKDEITRFGGHPVGVLAFPLDVAAQGVGQGDADRLPGEMLRKSAVEVVDLHLAGILGIVYSASSVDEFAILVEDIEVWRA
jgi:hypothetical protein